MCSSTAARSLPSLAQPKMCFQPRFLHPPHCAVIKDYIATGDGFGTLPPMDWDLHAGPPSWILAQRLPPRQESGDITPKDGIVLQSVCSRMCRGSCVHERVVVVVFTNVSWW